MSGLPPGTTRARRMDRTKVVQFSISPEEIFCRRTETANPESDRAESGWRYGPISSPRMGNMSSTFTSVTVMSDRTW